MNRSHRIRIAMLAAGFALSLLMIHPGRAEASPVTFELVVNVSADGNGHCLLASGDSCLDFTDKQYVWLRVRDLPTGSYLFAVLNSGDSNANDRASGNLSDDFDLYTNRTFGVLGGLVGSYAGTHTFAVDPTLNNDPLVRLFPFANTPNPGGGYTAAVCSLGNGYPVSATNCYYGNFTVNGRAAAVPEPASFVLLATGLALLARRASTSRGR